jgi:hypothetical protein
MDEQLKTPVDTQPTRVDKAVLQQPRFRLGAIVALAVAAGIVAWVIIGGGSSSTKTTAGPLATPIAPVAESENGLRQLAADIKSPVYWAGPKVGYTYELTRTAQGNVFVRYLPPGTKAGAPGANYLIIATYSFPNAFSGLQAVSNGSETEIPGGGIAVVDQKYPKSVHVAFEGVDYQIEVYDPSPSQARRVATSGDIQPVQ